MAYQFFLSAVCQNDRAWLEEHFGGSRTSVACTGEVRKQALTDLRIVKPC